MHEVSKMKNVLTKIEFLSKAKYKQNIWDFCGNYFNLYLKDNPSKIHYAQFDFVPKLLFYAGGITCFTFFIIHNCKRKNN